jgi:hypothetical protein
MRPGALQTPNSYMLGNVKPLRLWRAVLLFSLCAASQLATSAQQYESVSVDNDGRLHIVSDAGKDTVVSKSRGQTSFADVTISPDRRTVVWKIMAEDPTRNYFSELAFALGVFRGGRVLREIQTPPILWAWAFQDRGEHIVYATGSTHGGAGEAFLQELTSGRITAKWAVGEGPPPEWARGFGDIYRAEP